MPVRVEIPGYPPLVLSRVVLDFNGTLAENGRLLPGVSTRLRILARHMNVVVITADTFGTAHAQLHSLPVQLATVKPGQDKRDWLTAKEWGASAVIGNGRNDISILRVAALSIAVVGPEGMAPELLEHADVLSRDIREALDLLLHREKLTATLRR